MIVDEGDENSETMGRMFAQPAITEKGVDELPLLPNYDSRHNPSSRIP